VATRGELPQVARVARDLRGTVSTLLTRPDKMGPLLGGAVIGHLAALFAFVAAVHAYGVHMGLAQAGALYTVATTVGGAVPTPGGVGGVEAALTGALIGAGILSATAAAIVLLFRLFTFWLPTLPGWVALQYTQRTGIV
jgi:uncharacterized protein (TIRG00374 family)